MSFGYDQCPKCGSTEFFAESRRTVPHPRQRDDQKTVLECKDCGYETDNPRTVDKYLTRQAEISKNETGDAQ